MTKRLLIVDDDESVRSSLCLYFEEYDYEVFAAEDAKTALEILTDRSFDVGIIDMRLPDMSGDALIQAAHRIRHDMRFLIYTGSTNYWVSPELERLGMHQEHVIHKPINDMRMLKEKIDRIMEGGQ